MEKNITEKWKKVSKSGSSVPARFQIFEISRTWAVQPIESGNHQVAVGVDLSDVPDVEGDGHQLLGGQRVPLADGAAKVFLLLLTQARKFD